MKPVKETPPEQVQGHCLGGPCDGKEFLHTADMQRVKVSDGAKPKATLHVYVFHPSQTEQQGRRVYLWEKLEAWKF